MQDVTIKTEKCHDCDHRLNSAWIHSWGAETPVTAKYHNMFKSANWDFKVKVTTFENKCSFHRTLSFKIRSIKFTCPMFLNNFIRGYHTKSGTDAYMGIGSPTLMHTFNTTTNFWFVFCKIYKQFSVLTQPSWPTGNGANKHKCRELNSLQVGVCYKFAIRTDHELTTKLTPSVRLGSLTTAPFSWLNCKQWIQS